MIVVATDDFELYHEAVGELRRRGVEFTTVEPGGPLPESAAAAVVGSDDPAPEVWTVVARPDGVRRAIEEALAHLRDGGGRTVVGIDPGTRPGVAVLSGATVVAAFHLPVEEVVPTVEEETASAVNPVVRVGDGARTVGARIIEEFDGPVELVDETGTTPYLGTGTQGMGDVLAAVNIARTEGEVVEGRTVDPTAGELQRIKDRARERSHDNRALTDRLARQVARGELSLAEALEEHR